MQKRENSVSYGIQALRRWVRVGNSANERLMRAIHVFGTETMDPKMVNFSPGSFLFESKQLAIKDGVYREWLAAQNTSLLPSSSTYSSGWPKTPSEWISLIGRGIKNVDETFFISDGDAKDISMM